MPERPLFGADVRDQLASRLKHKVSPQSARRFFFVDFCPGGVIGHRQDVAWIQQGICTYEAFGSEEQFELFQSIAVGDFLVMKRSIHLTHTMLLHAYGRVFGFDLSEKRDRILLVNWTHEQGQIETPMLVGDDTLISCAPSLVQEVMPTAFWDWLKK